MTKNLTKIAILSLLLTKGAFAEFLPFVELAGGMYNHSGDVSYEIKIDNKSAIKKTFDFDKRTTFVASVGLGFVYQFNNNVFLGARISTQNVGKNLEINKTELFKVRGTPVFLNAILGFQVNEFRPYILAGYYDIRTKLNNDHSLLQYLEKEFINNKRRVLGGFYYGAGIEYEVSKSFTILAEYNQGSSSSPELLDDQVADLKGKVLLSAKLNTKYNYKMIKVGARYYFGR